MEVEHESTAKKAAGSSPLFQRRRPGKLAASFRLADQGELSGDQIDLSKRGMAAVEWSEAGPGLVPAGPYLYKKNKVGLLGGPKQYGLYGTRFLYKK